MWDELFQRDVLVLSDLLITGDRAISATTLSLIVTFEPDDPEDSTLVRWDSWPALDAGWTAEVVDPAWEGSATGAAVRYKRGGFTGTAPFAFGTALTPSNQAQRPLVSSDDLVPGRWRVRAEAAGFAPAELVLASPRPSGSVLTLQEWTTSSLERGAGSLRASLPGGVVIPPTGLTAAYKVRYTLRFVGAPTSYQIMSSGYGWAESGSVLSGAGLQFTSTYSVPARRSVVRAAAWSLPAVAVAAQAPAFAASGAADGFAFIPGGTRVVEANYSGGIYRWYDLRFEGASVRAGAGGGLPVD